MSNKSTNPDPNEGLLLFTTTEGRERFADLLQLALSEKKVVAFQRYRRVVGAMVPIEAVRILAGFSEDVDPDIRERVQRAAKALLMQAPSEAERLARKGRLAAASFSTTTGSVSPAPSPLAHARRRLRPASRPPSTAED